MSSDVVAIYNPQSAGGRTARRMQKWTPRLQEAFPGIRLLTTTEPNHATRLATDAVGAGARLVIAIGGDGTVSECANGLFVGDRPRETGVDFGLIMSGTGGDIRRTYGIGPAFDEQLQVLRQGNVRPIDTGHVRFVDHAGKDAERTFINTLSFGMSGKVCTAVKEGLIGRIGGRTSFYLASLKGALFYHNQQVRVRWDDRQKDFMINTFAVGNGRFFGGRMMIAPHAIPDDGQFDAVVVGDLKRRDVFLSMRSLYRGTHLHHPRVQSMPVTSLQAEALGPEPVLIECDGEGPGRLPLSLKLVPRSLRMVVPCP